MKPSLAEIQVPEGWYIQKNDIMAIEPKDWEKYKTDVFKHHHSFFDDDMFNAKHMPTLACLQCGWRPWNDPEGRFSIRLYKAKEVPDLRTYPPDVSLDWENPIIAENTTSTEHLCRRLGEIMCEISSGGDLFQKLEV